MSLRKSVHLYYDVMCPYSWIAFEQLCRYRVEWDVDVKLKPFSLEAVFMASNHGHSGTVAAKFNHMCRDVEIQGHYYGIPINTPSDVYEKMYKRGTLSAMRLLTVVNNTRPELTEHLSRSLWSRMWSMNRDITRRTSLIQAGCDIGLSDADMEYFLSKIREKCTTTSLRATTDHALRIGAFGAPTLLVDNTQTTHMLFGSDRMHIVAMLLGKHYEGQEHNRDLLISNTVDSSGCLAATS